MTTEEKFLAAVDVVNSLPQNGPFQPSDDLMLKFYAYYKQATVGPCCIPKPSFWEVVARNRWHAWNELGVMPKNIAMEKYVEELAKVVETMSYNEKVSKFISSMSPFYEIVYTDENDSPETDLSRGDIKVDMERGSGSSENTHKTFLIESNVSPTEFNDNSKYSEPLRCTESFNFGMGMSESQLSSSENSSTVSFEERTSSLESSDSESQPATITEEDIVEMFRNRRVFKNLPISTTKDLLILTVLNVQHSLEGILKHLERIESIASTTELGKNEVKCENVDNNKSWSLTFPGTALVLLWPLAVHWCMHLIKSSIERN